jgi:hypothetical protein
MEKVEDFAVLIIEIMVPLPGQELFQMDWVFEVDVMETATMVVIVNYVTVMAAAVLVDLTIVVGDGGAALPSGGNGDGGGG